MMTQRSRRAVMQAFARGNGRITRTELMVSTGCSEAAARMWMKELIAEGVVKPSGVGKRINGATFGMQPFAFELIVPPSQKEVS